MTKQDFINQINWAEPTVFIMRGIPGSGKSTLADEIFNKAGAYICSADDYWVQPDGSYKFDASQVPLNHHKCLRTFVHEIDNMKTGIIIVDNTNTAYADFAHYIKIAKAYGYKVVVVSLHVDIETSVTRNIHSVPKKTIEHMLYKFAQGNDILDPMHKKKEIEHFWFDTE